MKQVDYWKNRFTQLEDAQNSKALDYYSTLEDEFSRAARNTEKELAAWYTRFAKNENISYAEAKQVLSKGELSAFKMSVDDYIKKGKTLPYSDQWAKELERASAKFHVTRLEAIQLQMQQQVEAMYGYELDTFDQFIANQYKAGYYKTMFEFQKGFGVGFDVMKLDDNRIAKLIAKPWAPDGQNFSSRIWRDKNKLMTEMPSILTQATIRGDGYAKTTKILAERFNVSKAQAKNLVITESAFFSSTSQTDCFNDLGVKQYEIIATLDGKTSQICRMMDGKVFDMKDRKPGITAPPFHGRCRSTSAPYFNDEFELNTKRAARDPDTGKTYRVPADMKYPDWEKSFVDGGKKDGLEILKGGIINIVIDQLTPCLKRLSDNKIINTTVEKITPAKDMFKDWEFDWTQPEKNGFSVFGLKADGDDRIQGLVALKQDPNNYAVLVDIVEAAPFNNKHNKIYTAKEYSGVGGHLFAEAVKQSTESGYGGFVYFKAKTNLIEHYKKELGAVLINPAEHTMAIDEKAAVKLFNKYYGGAE